MDCDMWLTPVNVTQQTHTLPSVVPLNKLVGSLQLLECSAVPCAPLSVFVVLFHFTSMITGHYKLMPCNGEYSYEPHM